MPETERKLVLHSPASSEHVEYRWPLHRTETWDEAVEIVETIRWVCRDFPDLKLAVEKFILNSFEPTSFESMKQLCERYNRAVANIKKLWSGRQPPPGIDAPPSIPLLRHIINQVYNRSVTKPEDLNSYEPFSPEVYGETSFELVCEVMKHTKMTENDVFVDLGSGVGQVVLQVAAKVGCKCYGIEKADIPAKFAERMEEEFVRWMDWYGKSYGEFEIMKGDFLDPEFNDIMQSATVVFTNNFAFGPKLNHELKLKFANLKDGTKIVSSHEFCPLNFRITPRNMSDIGSIMHVAELSPLKGSVSWTGKQVSYYLHTIDRGKLEKFYLRQKHPDEYKSESSSQSGTESSDDSSDSSSESDDDHFKSALQRIKLEHYSRAGSKKGAKPGEHKKKRWQKPSQLKSKDSNSSALSSSSVSSPGLVDIDGLFTSFHNQLEAYMGQLGTPHYQQWITDAIEKEKMKKNHLQGVINHLESEVAVLSRETVDQMKENMKELGIQKMTPDGLLLGAKSIVSQNKQLRKEMNDLEKEITTLREQNKAMEAMCANHKADPKLLPKLPLFSPEGEILTNGISSPQHVVLSSREQGEQLQVTLMDLKEAKALSVGEGVVLSSVDPKHTCLGLVKEYQIELERIDQQLLELGPYAQDAYEEEEPQTVQVLVSPPPPEVKRGKRTKNAAASHKTVRRPSRGLEEMPDMQKGGWRVVGGGFGEVSDRRPDDKELPKKKWRKVGSAGPAVRGKEGQLDAQSDPLNVSSANIINTPASDLEMRAIYQPPQGSKQKVTPGEEGQSHSSSPAQMASQQERQLEVSGHRCPNELSAFSVSTTAHSTPSCNTTSPMEAHGHSRTQPTAHWKPIPGGATHSPQQDIPHPLQEGYARHKSNYAHLPQQVLMDTSGASEEVDVTKVEDEESPRFQMSSAAVVARQSEGLSLNSPGGYETHPHHVRRESHGSHHSEVLSGRSDLQQTPSPSPKTTIHGPRPTETNQHLPNAQILSQHNLSAGNLPKQPGFSISHLTKGSDFSVQSPAHDSYSYLEPGRASLSSGMSGERSVVSPHGEVDGSMRKRRSSSSSSHRSTRQHPIDDNSLARAGSPLSARGQYVPGIIWDGGTAVHSPKDKPPTIGSSDKIGMIPFSMWPPGMPVPPADGGTGQVQRYPLSSPFLTAPHHWLRGGMLPFRPALYPAGAAALDPYKSMLGLPLYQFPPTGLKGAFATPAFSSPSSVSNSQPQTPSSISSTAGFPFGQYPLQQGMTPGAVQGRLTAGGAIQHPSLAAVGKDGKPRGSPEASQDTPQQPWPMLPGMPMMQAPFSFGVQNPLSSSMTQASQLNLLAQRGPLAFSTSPLTLATQSAAAGASSGDVQQSTAEAYHQTSVEGRRSKKQSGSTIDLTGRDQVVKHIQAPSPQEAVKMATQRLQDSPRFSPKLKNPPDSIVAATSSSPLIATFVTNPNTLSTQAQGSVLSYPVLSAPGAVGSSAINMPPGHLINPSQLMGVALSGNHMIPMNYQPVTNVSGKAEDGGGKKKSPKRGGGSQKLRIHQMDFKSQGKIDRRRKQLKLPDKPQEESNVGTSAGAKPGVSAQPTAVSSEPPSSVSSLISEDNYALNMLADCSTKEGGITKQVQVMSASQQSQDLASKRALMRSPGSIAGANSLLLLSKPDTISSAGNTARSRGSPPENAVVDGLLKLSNSSISPPRDESNGSKDNENRSVLESGAQSVVASLTSREEMDSRSEEVGEAAEGKDKCDVDSEKTDTDSEATLTPTTPAGKWPQATLATQNGTATRHREKTPSSTAPTPPPEFVKPTDVLFRKPLDSVPPQDNQSPSDSIEAPSESYPTNQPSVSSTETPREPTPPSQANVTSSIPSLPQQSEGASSTVESLSNGSITETTAPPAGEERDKVEEVSGIQPLPDAKEERELLDLGPPSSRLEMIDDEEDADVDVENIDSSLLDEPDPAISSPQSKSPVSTTQPPDVAPPQGDVCPNTSPSHPPLQPDPPSLTREPKEDKIVHESQEEEMHPEEEPLLAPTSEEAELDMEVPSPKRPRVEESEKAVETALEEDQVHEAMETVPQKDQCDEVMDTETSHIPVPGTISPSTSSAQVTSPVLPVSDVAPPTFTPPPESHPPSQSPTTQSEQMAAELPKDDVELHTTEDVEGDDSRSCRKLGNVTTKLPDVQDTCTAEMGSDEAPSLKETIAPDTTVATEPLATSGTVAVQEKLPHPTNHDEGGDGIAGSPSACTSGPTESDKQVPTEMKTSPVQKPTMPTSPNPIEMDSSNDCTSTNPLPIEIHSRSSSPVANEKSSNYLQEDGSKQVSSDLAQVEKSTTEDAPQVPSDAVSKVCQPVAQNRLPVGKSGFDRHQQHRKLMSQQHTHKQHSRDEKSLQSKKWSRGPPPDPASRTRGLFDVDPQESKRQKTENRGPERELVRYSSEGRKVKPRVLPSAHGHSNKQSVDHSKYNSRPPRSGSEDSSHRHSRPPLDGPQGSTWDQRESSKQKVRPSGRQGQRFSPLPSHLTEHNSGHLKDRDVPLSLSDEEQARSERARVGHQNSHGWRDGRHSPTDHARDKSYTSSKHKTGHRADSKQGFEHARKIVRLDKEKDQRKHTIIAEANTDERATVFKRHREEDADHGSVRQKLGAVRKRSYESVSEDELPEESNQSSSRESSLVAEDRNGRSERRSSLETPDQHGSVWRKEQKRAPEGSNTEEVSRISKHKKHKHSSKDWKERRKWRKPTDSNDQKVKHGSEDKMWLSYHKH